MYIIKRPQIVLTVKDLRKVVLTVKDLQAIRTTLLILDEVLDKDDDLALDTDTSSIARAYEALCDFVNNCEVDEGEE